MEREHNIEQTEPMGEKELLTLIEQLKNDLDAVESTHGGMPKMFEEHKQLYEDFVERMLAQKNRFANIFRSEKGSTYFILLNGKSLRIKNLKYGYELQPIADEIKFIQESPKEQSTSLDIGATPYETFYIQKRGETDERHHRGHKITEILK